MGKNNAKRYGVNQYKRGKKMATKKEYKKSLKEMKKSYNKLLLSLYALRSENTMLHKINDDLMQENRKLKIKSEIGTALLEESEKEMIKQDAVIEHYEDKFEYKGSK